MEEWVATEDRPLPGFDEGLDHRADHLSSAGVAQQHGDQADRDRRGKQRRCR